MIRVENVAAAASLAGAGRLCLAVVVWAATAAINAAPAAEPGADGPLRSSRPLATWVWDWWDHQTPMTGEYFEAYAGGLLEFCDRKHIGTLYLAVDFPIPETRVGVTEQLLERAHARGIRVEASAASQRGDEAAGLFMRGVLEWNRGRPAARRFDGAHFDHEEYTASWLEAIRGIWEGGVLAELKALDPRFRLGAVAVPAMWWGTEERRQEYAYRLQDATDYVAVMSYYQGDTTLGFFTGPSRPAIDYAARTGKTIEIGLEVSIWRGEGECFPGWEYMSFFPQGEAELLHRVEKINAAFAGERGFGGVVIQSSDAYQRLELVGGEIARQRRLHGQDDASAEPLPADAVPVEIADFTERAHHGAEDPAVQTRLATFAIEPALTPGHVLAFELEFAAYDQTRHNPLTDGRVPAELLWFGFLDAEPAYRFLRLDFNGGLGMRAVTGLTAGPPGGWRDLFWIAPDRFVPEPGKAYEGRLALFGDGRVMLKILDPQAATVVWHSDRMPCDRGRLGRMYAEIVGAADAHDAVTHDAAHRAVRFTRGGEVVATLRNLRLAASGDR